MERKIVSAALMINGLIISAPIGARHGDLIQLVSDLTDRVVTPDEQGFLTNDGRFASRRAAASIALKSKQVTELKYPGHGLYSEDLW